MPTDITAVNTDDLDLTVQVVTDPATGRTAIGLGNDATAALFDLLDAMNTQTHDLMYSFGFDRADAEMVSEVAGQIRAGLRKVRGY